MSKGKEKQTNKQKNQEDMKRSTSLVILRRNHNQNFQNTSILKIFCLHMAALPSNS